MKFKTNNVSDPNISSSKYYVILRASCALSLYCCEHIFDFSAAESPYATNWIAVRC